MKDQPWDLNQTWHVGRKWCRFVNAPQKFWVPQKIGEENITFLPLFL